MKLLITAGLAKLQLASCMQLFEPLHAAL